LQVHHSTDAEFEQAKLMPEVEKQVFDYIEK